MGIFDFFKKNKKKSAAVTELEQAQTDFMNEVIPLVTEGIEKGIISAPKDNNHNSFGESLEHLDEDGELPFGWYSHNEEYIKKVENKLANYATSLRNQNTENRIKTLKEMIAYYYSVKNEFYSKGECFKKCFSDMWEHCHNSKNNDFEYITRYEEELEIEVNNYDKSIKKEKVQETHLPTLERDILNIIKTNDGILQTDLYKLFPAELKEDIKNKLYFMCNFTKKIKREKSGRTYKIYENK